MRPKECDLSETSSRMTILGTCDTNVPAGPSLPEWPCPGKMYGVSNESWILHLECQFPG